MNASQPMQRTARSTILGTVLCFLLAVSSCKGSTSSPPMIPTRTQVPGITVIPAKPAPGMPSGPGPSNPSGPGPSMPSGPGPGMPSGPGPSNPSGPAPGTPPRPGPSNPSGPAPGTPPRPGPSNPSRPAPGMPSGPGLSNPSGPGPGTPPRPGPSNGGDPLPPGERPTHSVLNAPPPSHVGPPIAGPGGAHGISPNPPRHHDSSSKSSTHRESTR